MPDRLQAISDRAASANQRVIRPGRSPRFNLLCWCTFRKWQIVRAW